MAAAPTTPYFASQAIALLLAELEQLNLDDLRATIDEVMAEARAEREAKLAELGPDAPPLPPILKGGCGDAYSDLLIVRGNTPDDPCGPLLEEWACNELDAKAYNARADEIYAYCLAAWNLLIEAENKRQDWAESEVLKGDPFWSSYEAMKRFSEGWVLVNPLHVAEVVASSLTVMREGTCCLQKLNEALDRVTNQEVTPPFVPEDDPLIDLDDLPKPISNAMTFIGLAVAVAIGFVVYGRLKK